eukprot:CCRYP_002682-RA/>CCRYP_002682-RA protein AED:0.46 eAED:0.46 QI:0/0/0/1/0/0/2/0/145
MLEQYEIKKGIKLLGKEGKRAKNEELMQLHDYVIEQKKEALESLTFLTKKQCGRVKARACFNGSKQHHYICKENAMSPTVGRDSIFITSVIEAHKERHVVTLNIPGAFLHRETDEMVPMLLGGETAKLMLKVDPVLYRSYITKND